MPLNLQYNGVSYIILSKWLINSWIIYLNIRQLMMISSQQTVPPYLKESYPPEHLTMAKSYQFEKVLLTLIFRFYDTFVFTAEIYGGAIPLLWHAAEWLGDSDASRASAYMALNASFETIIYLPLRLFNVFVIEQRYGFNRQDLESFIGDAVKEVVAKSIVSIPIVYLTIVIMRWRPDTYQYYLMVLTLVFRVLLIVAYLEFLIPMLATFKPLPDGPLKERIKELATTVDFPLYDIYVMEASSRTTHGNAFFIGLGSRKMIVFFDTMLEGHLNGGWLAKKRYTEDELLGILGHEMGHWNHQHVAKALCVFQMVTCFEMALCGEIAKQNGIYRAVGFRGENPPIFIGFLAISQLFIVPFEMLVHYLTRWLSREFEYEADQFSATLGLVDGLVSGLKKISSESLKLPKEDALYSSWYDTHPTLDDRLKALIDTDSK